MSFLTRLTTLKPRTALPKVPIRTFTSTPSPTFPRKNAQDRRSIDTESTEYTKSGTDDQSIGDQAFDPKTTRPETEKNKSGGKEDRALDVSPANKDVSGQREGSGDAENSGKEGGGMEGGGRSGFGSGGKGGS